MLTLIAVVLIVTLLLYAVQLLPLDGRIATVLQLLIIIVAVIYVVDAIGVR